MKAIATKPINRAVRGARSGFTLIELLVVIALTAILMTVIFKPLVDSYNLTSRAGTEIQAQAAARNVIRDIGTELGNAAYVYDNSSAPMQVWLSTSGGAQYSINMQYGLLDYIIASRQEDELTGPAIAIDPTTGSVMYNTTSPSQAPYSGYSLPLTPGYAISRYFIGLMSNNMAGTGAGATPVKPYGNHFEDPTLVTLANDNRYTLYHAQVPAYIPDPSGVTPGFIPNFMFFHTVTKGTNTITDTLTPTDTIQVHNPSFFYDTSLAGYGPTKGSKVWAAPGWKDLNGDGQVEIFENWAAVSSSVLPLDKVDVMTLNRFADTNAVIYYNNGTPDPEGATPAAGDTPLPRALTTFTPAFVQNEAAVPTTLDNSGNESASNLSALYQTQYSHWSSPYRVMIYRAANGGDPLQQNPLTYYEVIGDGNIYAESVAPGTQPPTPAGNVGPLFDPATGAFTNINAQFAFTIDPERGRVNFAFPSTVMVNGGAPGYQPLPQSYSPADVNATLANNLTSIPFRYIDLTATLPTDVWNGSVLNAPTAVSPLSPLSNWFSTVHIVPGSERIFGPDQNPGPHYGYRILYTRVSALTATPGPNQYTINYDKNSLYGTDPATQLGFVAFRSTPDSSTPNTPDDPANHVYKVAGLPELKVDPTTGLDIPSDPIEINYSFQMNQPNDVVKIDYLTRELINISLQVRLYDPATSTPQVVTLNDRIKVHNLQR